MAQTSKARVEFCLIGSCAVDLLESAGERIIVAGGTVVYTAATLRHLGPRLAVIANGAARDAHLFRWMTQGDGIIVHMTPTPHSTIFRNIYYKGDRTQFLESISGQIEFDLSSISSDVIYFGPLIQSDIDLKLYFAAHNHSALVAVDMQGRTRPRAIGPVSLHYHPAIRDVVAGADIIKVNEAEAHIVFGTRESNKISNMINSGQEVLLTLGERGAWIIGAAGNIYQPAIPPTEELDPSGCGDVFCATYAYYRVKGADVSIAALEAAKLASLNVATIGVPFLEPENRRCPEAADSEP